MLDILGRVGSLDEALAFTPAAGDGLSLPIPLSLSNGVLRREPRKGGPFGGFMLTAAVRAAREILGATAPLRTVTVQFLSAARFEPVRFEAEALRGGRSALFAGVRAAQGDKPVLAALAAFGADGAGPAHRPLAITPARPLHAIETSEIDAPFRPWFTRWVEYRFALEPRFGEQDEAVVKVWMRLKDGKPLDEARLCFLMDAIWPNFFMVTDMPMTVTADMRVDVFDPLTPDVSPEGWAYFEFRTGDAASGWAVEDGVAVAPDGRPLGVARQLRKVLAKPA